MFELNIHSCIGCGYCCMKSPCSAATRLFGKYIETCPLLQWRESRYYCRLMELPGSQGEKYREELFSGLGCGSTLNSWRKDIKNRTPKKDEINIFNLDPLFQIFLSCLGKDCFISSDKIYLICSSMSEELKKKGVSKETSNKISFDIVESYIKQWRSKQSTSFMG